MVAERPVTIITGGASGMGEAAVRLLVGQGHSVVFGDIQDERGHRLATEIGECAIYVHADMTRESDVVNLVDGATQHFGPITGFVNNAGIVGAVGAIDSISVEEWDFTIEALLRSTFLGVKHAARAMKTAKRGSIVNATSIAAFRGAIGPHPYAAAKAGIVALTMNAAAELGCYGIRVNAVAPGRIATPLVADTWAGNHEDIEAAKLAIAADSPLAGRVGTAEDVASAYAWLLSDSAGYVTGQTICVDGGVLGGVPPANIASERLSRYQTGTAVIREAGRRGLPQSPGEPRP